MKRLSYESLFHFQNASLSFSKRLTSKHYIASSFMYRIHTSRPVQPESQPFFTQQFIQVHLPPLQIILSPITIKMYVPSKRTLSTLPCLLLFLLLILPLVAQALVLPLNSTDANGCRIGSEFRDGKCRLCRPGHYRFLVPAPDNRPDWIRLPEHDPFQCPDEYDGYNLTTEPSAAEACVPCPAGTYYPFFGSQSAELCLACPAGTTSVPGSRSCAPCPRRRSSTEGSAKCVRCPRGSHLTKPCFRGRSPMGTGCMKCPKGSYASSVNAEECTKCPPGMSTRSVGARWKGMCEKCGTNGVKCSCQRKDKNEPSNAVASYRPIGADSCITCPPGSRAFTPFATSKKMCVSCPNGTMFTAGKGCVECGTGLKSFGRGASICRAKWSDNCPSGSFKTKRGVCHICPPGYSYNAAARQCEQCPNGSVSDGGLQTSCETCAFPEIAPASGIGICSCGRNYFRETGGQKRCVKCAKGRKKDKDLHNDQICQLDCDAVPDQEGCKRGCPKDFGRERGSGNNACKRCEAGLRSPAGEGYCRHARTGCFEADHVRALTLSRFGFYLVCASPDTETLF